MPAIETTFVDLTTVVPASWFNTLQKHLAGFMNLRVSVSGDAVQVVGATDNGVASVYIGGEMRRNETTASHTFVAEGAGTYNVYAVATAAVDTFAIEVSTTTPATSPYRKIAEVDWDGADITELRGVRATKTDEHDHSGYAQPKVPHSALADLTSGDPHTQYVLPDGSRPFTGAVVGVTPVGASDLATRAYADGILLTVPIGSIFYWPSDDPVPTGFLECDGAAVSRTTYASLFATISTTYGAGNGTTTFNVPGATGRMFMGKAASTSLNAKGGSLTHSHTLAGHTHVRNAHTHPSTGHTHTGPTTAAGGSHTHTQGSTGTDGSHTHSGPSHTHSGSGVSVGTSGSASTALGRHPGTGDSGLYTADDMATYAAGGTSHSHSDGSYAAAGVPVSGSSSSASFPAHYHGSAGNSYAHTHGAGAVSGSTASNSATTGSDGSHSHTNPTTAASATHTHAAGGATGSASPTTASGGGAATGSGGSGVTGDATYPFTTVRAIIRAT